MLCLTNAQQIRAEMGTSCLINMYVVQRSNTACVHLLGTAVGHHYEQA